MYTQRSRVYLGISFCGFGNGITGAPAPVAQFCTKDLLIYVLSDQFFFPLLFCHCEMDSAFTRRGQEKQKLKKVYTNYYEQS